MHPVRGVQHRLVTVFWECRKSALVRLVLAASRILEKTRRVVAALAESFWEWQWQQRP